LYSCEPSACMTMLHDHVHASRCACLATQLDAFWAAPQVFSSTAVNKRVHQVSQLN
jgi:hypothetical protein